MFDAYSAAVGTVTDHVRATVAKDPADTDFVFRQATRAKALDATRGMLPAAALSNVGIYGTGQGFEGLLLRLRAHPLPEARAYAELMLEELRKVIPSFLRRVDVPDRGGRWTEYLATTRMHTASLVDEMFAAEPIEDAATVTLVDFDPDAENKLLAAICYPHSRLSETQLLDRVRGLGADERRALVAAYVGSRENRRHKPGRAFERLNYRFDILSDYGAFRDLQRHRLLTIEWQPLTPNHGYVRPELIDESGGATTFDESMERSAELFADIAEVFPEQASYAVAMAYRVRFVMQFNAREAIHLIELRSGSQGHPAYRRVALEMHRLIAEQAGHTAVAEAMTHLTTDAPELERLEAERRAETRRG
jgi:thymidylate synthase ThyX